MNQDATQEPLIGLAALMRMAYSGADLTPLGAQLIERIERNPRDANALMDLSTALQLKGSRDVAMSMQAQALQLRQLYHAPRTCATPAIRLLALMGPGDLMANTPLEFLVEDSDIALDMLYVGPGVPAPTWLPEHDVLLVAIGESDENLPLLAEMDKVMKDWERPVLNRPDHIAWLSRDGACVRLKSLPGVVMPITARIAREALQRIGSGESAIADVLDDGAFPIIVRPVDSHAGRGLDKLDDAAAIAVYLQANPESEFYISRFVDYRGADGLYRKCRIVLIDGRPFVAHMAISQHWMIHYLNAGMSESQEKRAEEARFMASFDEDFARRHAEAFHAIDEAIGLDYLGIDCGETPDGALLIFEVDSNMIVHAIDPVDLFPYKQPQMRKVFAAFRAMLAKAMQQSRGNNA